MVSLVNTCHLKTAHLENTRWQKTEELNAISTSSKTFQEFVLQIRIETKYWICFRAVLFMRIPTFETAFRCLPLCASRSLLDNTDAVSSVASDLMIPPWRKFVFLFLIVCSYWWSDKRQRGFPSLYYTFLKLLTIICCCCCWNFFSIESKKSNVSLGRLTRYS